MGMDFSGGTLSANALAETVGGLIGIDISYIIRMM